MFAKKTVFVVGAGASKEVGLPTGPELADKIASLLYFEFDPFEPSKGDRDFYYAMKKHFNDHQALNEHLSAARQISESVRLVNSIDNYIDIHRQDQRISTLGKAALTHSILKSESNSILRLDPNSTKNDFDLNTFSKTWLLHFGRALTNNVALDDINSIFRNVAIICFNYDRCIEHFLTLWLSSVYTIDEGRSRELVKSLEIIRPYGMIGDLATVPFGSRSALQSIFRHSQNIRTYTEQNENTAITNSIHTTIRSAETLIFLGIAYHPQNIQMLRTNLPWNVERILGSAIGFSASDVQDIKAELLQLTYPRQSSQEARIDISNDCTCANIFTTFSRAFRSAA